MRSTNGYLQRIDFPRESEIRMDLDTHENLTKSEKWPAAYGMNYMHPGVVVWYMRFLEGILGRIVLVRSYKCHRG